MSFQVDSRKVATVAASSPRETHYASHVNELPRVKTYPTIKRSK